MSFGTNSGSSQNALKQAALIGYDIALVFFHLRTPTAWFKRQNACT
jgi:hypothetical protein